MNILMDELNGGAELEEFGYRLVYLRPTSYAEERIVVGLLATRNERIEARFISAPSVIDLMTQVFGEPAVEQFQFGANEVRRALASRPSVDEFVLPTDLFVLGETLSAVTSDREGLLANILSSASSLVRAGVSRGVEIVALPAALHLQRDLFDQVNRLNPLLGKRIFNQKFTSSTGEVMRLPILGDRVFGAPISFATRNESTKAEAYVAKFRWLRDQMPQEPRIYLLTPPATNSVTRLDPGLRELCAIAEALEVPVQISESTEGMATQLLKDEAA
jgi:hypothetical protein